MKRIVVGISGASGAIMGFRLLEALRAFPEIQTHLVVSESAKVNFELETRLLLEEVYGMADVVYEENDLAAAISSGTFNTDGMVVIPCSMKTLSGIANAYDDNLLIRAAGVCLKEHRKLVIVARETPLSLIHLRNMEKVAEAGAILLPPMLTFYNSANTLDEQVNHIIGKVLMQFDLESPSFKPWSQGVITPC